MKIMKYLFILMLAFSVVACDDDEVEITPVLSFKDKTVIFPEGAGVVKVPLQLTAATSEATTVYVKLKEGSESGGREGTKCTFPAYIVLEAGAVRGNFPVTIVDNDYPNEDYVFELEIIAVTGGAVKGSDNLSCRFTVADDDNKQQVSVGFDSLRYEVNENAGSIDIPVTVKGLLSDYLTVSAVATDGTATEADYRMRDATVRIEEGESWGVVTVDITDSKAMKEDRTFKVKLIAVEGCSPEDTTVTIRPWAQECEVTIKKVVRKMEFAQELVEINEASKVAVNLSVRLTAPVDQDVTFKLQAKEGSTAVEHVNYEIASKELTIREGESIVTTKITVIDDKLGNEDRWCDFEIVGIEGGVELVEGTTCRLLIENDDSSIGFESSEVVTLKGRKVILPIKLAGLREQKVTMEVEAVTLPGVDKMTHYMILNNKLAILPGDSVVNVEVQIMQPADKKFDVGIEIVGIEGESLSQVIVPESGKQSCVIHVGAVNAEKLDLKNIAGVEYASSESPAGEKKNGGMATSLIDEDMNTWWHSKWASGDTDDGTRPYTIIFKLDQSYTYGKVRVDPRPGKADNLTGVVIDVSDDQENWKRLVELTQFGAPVDVDNMVGGQYVRLQITGNTGGVANASELNLWSVDL